MIGFIGFILIIISIVAGYNDWYYWISIASLATIGMILYFVQSPVLNLLIFAQDGWLKLLNWIAWVFFSQALTWSIFYYIGSLFG